MLLHGSYFVSTSLRFLPLLREQASARATRELQLIVESIVLSEVFVHIQVRRERKNNKKNNVD